MERTVLNIILMALQVCVINTQDAQKAKIFNNSPEPIAYINYINSVLIEPGKTAEVPLPSNPDNIGLVVSSKCSQDVYATLIEPGQTYKFWSDFGPGM